MMIVVSLAFLMMDGDQLVAQICKLAAVTQAAHCLVNGHGGRHQNFRLLHEDRRHDLDVKKRKSLGQRVNSVDDVIELADQRMNVLAIERCNECTVQAIEG